jgi:hypothetical protein
MVSQPSIRNYCTDINSTCLSGEPYLRCVAKWQNKKIYDEERRSVGPKIDIIFFHKLYEQELALLELSGPLHKTNHTHFLEDRHKTAKNLKHILKSIIDSKSPSSAAAIKKLKVYGFHLYGRSLYVLLALLICNLRSVLVFR